MTSGWKGLLSAAALGVTAMTATPASAQFFDRGDGPPPFRRGPGWDGPRPDWEHRHHRRHWRHEGFDRPGWRDRDRRGGRDRFGDQGDDRGGGERRRDDARRDGGNDDAPRRGGPGRGPRFGNDDE